MNLLKIAIRAGSAIGLALLAACQNPNGIATIRFEQLGACNGYMDGSSAISAGPTAAFVLFRINTIDNKSGKVPFNYDPGKVCLSSNSSSCISTTLSLAQKIGALGTTSTTVAAGQVLQHNGFAVIAAPTANSPDPQIEANQTNYFLTYNTGASDPGILFDKKNSSQIQYQGLPNCLGKVW
jgi:hypothetical protein